MLGMVDYTDYVISILLSTIKSMLSHACCIILRISILLSTIKRQKAVDFDVLRIKISILLSTIKSSWGGQDEKDITNFNSTKYD